MQFKEWLFTEEISHYLPELTQKLKQFPSQGIYVHFAKINKVGVRPNTFHGDPYGIYAFPKDYILSNQISRNPGFFELPYTFILQINPDARVLDLSKITSEQAQKWNPNYKLNHAMEPMQASSPGRFFWRSLDGLTERMDQRRGSMAKHKYLRNLGFEAVLDPGLSIIHSNEPSQVVFLTRCFKVVNLVENKPNIILRKGLAKYVLEKVAKAILGDFRLNFSQYGPYSKSIKAQGQKEGVHSTLHFNYSTEGQSRELWGDIILSYPNLDYKSARISIKPTMNQEQIEEAIQEVITSLEKFKPESFDDHTERVRAKLREVVELLGLKQEVRTDRTNHADFVKHYSFGKLLGSLFNYKGATSFTLTFKGNDLPTIYGTVEGDLDAKEMLGQAFKKWEEAILIHYNPKPKNDADYYAWKNGLTGEKLLKVFHFFKNKLNRSLQRNLNYV